MIMIGIEHAIRRSRHLPMSSSRTIIPTEFPKHVDGFSKMTGTLNGGKSSRMTCFGFPPIQVVESRS
jgi:hypothetical protein